MTIQNILKFYQKYSLISGKNSYHLEKVQFVFICENTTHYIIIFD